MDLCFPIEEAFLENNCNSYVTKISLRYSAGSSEIKNSVLQLFNSYGWVLSWFESNLGNPDSISIFLRLDWDYITLSYSEFSLSAELSVVL